MRVTSRRPTETPPLRVVESVQRAMEICRLLLDGESDAGLSVTQAARALGVDKSTVSRLLGTLTVAGMTIVDEPTRRYHVGPLAFQMGNRFQGAAFARVASPALRRLADSVNATANLVTLQGNLVLYLLVAQSNSMLRIFTSAGDTRCAHASAAGKAMLSVMPEAERDSLLQSLVTGSDGRLPEISPKTVTDMEQLVQDLNRSKKRGFTESNEIAEIGVSALAMAVPGAFRLPLAVSIAFASTQYRRADERRKALAELQIAVDSIGQAFGALPV